jgi:hypothetical protein
VDRRGDLGEDMMAAERVGGALVAEAWAHALSHRVWGGGIFLGVFHCMQVYRRRVCLCLARVSSGPRQSSAPSW